MTNVNKTWWREVCHQIHGTPTNSSWSGSRVTGSPKGGTQGWAGCSDKRIQDAGRNGTPDIIFCFMGANDWAHDTDLGTWSAGDPVDIDTTANVTSFSYGYALMLTKLKTAYPTSTIYCFTIIDDKKRNESQNPPPCENGNGVSIPTWNAKIKEIAQAFDVSVIDVHECGITYNNADTYLFDGTHPNASGMEMIADYVINELN